MESQLLSLSKIFSERLFRIPDYQRGYAWNEKQLIDFWNDLIQLDEDKNHYVGVLTLEIVPEDKYKLWEDDLWIINSKSFIPFYVVDGQQRLTTSIILIQSIVEVVNKSLNYTKPNEIIKKFIFDSKDGRISQSYIFGYEKDNPSYEFLKTKILNMESENNFPEQQETAYTSNLETAKKFFLMKLKKLEHDKIEIIYKKLTQKFLFNIFTISENIDVFVAFETMNNRGKLLSYLELLKNRLIYLSTHFKTSEIEKNRLRKKINECWKDIYHYLGKNKFKPLDDDEFLQLHFFIHFPFKNFIDFSPRKILRINGLKKTISDILLEQIFIKNNISKKMMVSINESFTNCQKVSIGEELDIHFINSYVTSLKASVKDWYYVNNPKDSKYSISIKDYFEKINRLPNMKIRALLLLFLHKNSDEKLLLNFVKSLEKYIFVMFYLIDHRIPIDFIDSIELVSDEIIGYKKNSLVLIIKNFSENKITSNDVLDYLNKHNSKLESFAVDIWAKETFKNGFYSWDGLKYFLYEYELSLYSTSKTKRLKLLWQECDYNSIEHIYPQNARNKYWTERFNIYTPIQKKYLKDSLGNLVLVSKEKNSSLSNKSFPEKVSVHGRTVGYKYGSYSEIELTNYSEWNSKSILERGLKLLSFMERRWNFKISSKNKIKILNLEFLEKKN